MANKIQGCLHVVRGGERKLRLPGKSVEIKADGTLWYQGYPILGIDDPVEKARVADLARARKEVIELVPAHLRSIGATNE